MGPASSTARTRVRLVVLALGLLLGAELALQLVAAVDARRTWREPNPVDPGRVLVIGDGLAFGVGVPRAAAVPARLEGRLRAAAWRAAPSVANGGWPWRSSAAVVRRLVDQLDEQRPGTVVVLAGNVDFVRAADVVERAELWLGDGFVWRWRLGGLLAAAFDADADADADADGDGDGEAPAAREAFVGTWYVGALPVVFADDGALALGAEVGTWELTSAGVLRFALPAGRFDVDWRFDRDELELKIASTPTLRLRRRPAGGADSQARIAVQAGELDFARWLLLVDGNGAAPTAEALVARIELDALEGDLAAARRGVALLDRRLDGRPPSERVALAARARLAVGDVGAVVELVESSPGVVAERPQLQVALAVTAWSTAARRRLARALSAVAPSPAVASVRAWLDAGPGLPAELAAAPPIIAAPSTARDRVEALRANLDSLVELVGRWGSDVVLVTTSADHPDARVAVAAIAVKHVGSVRHVDVRLEQGEIARRWVPVTLTAAGYARIADAVADELERAP